jgi:hypothetical protein
MLSFDFCVSIFSKFKRHEFGAKMTLTKKMRITAQIDEALTKLECDSVRNEIKCY